MTHWYYLSYECDGGRADRGKRSVEEMLRISTRTGPDVWIVSVINCWMGNSWVIWLCWFGWFGGGAAVYLEMDYRCWYEPSLTNAPIGQIPDRSTMERSTPGEVKLLKHKPQTNQTSGHRAPDRSIPWHKINTQGQTPDIQPRIG